MIAVKTYNILLNVGVCSTQAEFSRNWLGASDRYFSFLLATGRDPHMTALMGLAARLERLTDHLSIDTRFTKQAQIFSNLVDEMWDHMRARAVATTPKRRGGKSTQDALPAARPRSAACTTA
ncbi:DUF6626 family protein [Azospirillum isscasi]|uniref:Uncharacterized protein n=1 Tax=Azospirillum isscasi TaxID=3053926 RepID=A0ABU0WQI2_9PROT|nr:DUF6626 family protein [Azospirillum isscasi]MDQ2106436.1 hypothetical protein [Azospirillum isscasi]